jgi:hypothetical protein
VTGPGALRWWRRAALVVVAVLSTVLACQRDWLDRRPVAEERYELLPVSSDAVHPDWSSLQVHAEAFQVRAETYGDEPPMLRLGPLGLKLDYSLFFRGKNGRTLRLCDASNCVESAVALWSAVYSGEQPNGPYGAWRLPEGTWRLRRDDGRGQWLVSFEGRNPSSPETLAAAVLRSPVPLAVRRPLDAVYCVFGAALLTLASVLWRLWRAARPRAQSRDDALWTGAISAFALASVIVMVFWSPPMVAPAWDVQTLHDGVRPSDWRGWPLADVSRAPEGLSARWLGAWEIRQARDSIGERFSWRTRAGILWKDGARADICLLDSCARVDPRAWSAGDGASALEVYGLRRRPDGDEWVVTYADGDVEADVGVPWRRVRHTESLVWTCVAIAMACLLFDIIFLSRLERRRRTLDDDSVAKVPWSFRSTCLSRVLTTVAVGCSLAQPEFYPSLADSGRYYGAVFVRGLSAAMLGMAGVALLRPEDAGAGRFWRRCLWLLPLVLVHATVASWASISAGRLPMWQDAWAAAQTAIPPSYWWPALLYPIVFYAIPMVWSHGLAKNGLASAERGDKVVAVAAIAASLFSWVMLPVVAGDFLCESFFAWSKSFCEVEWEGVAGAAFLDSLTIVGLLAGTAAFVLVLVRASKRRAFMKRAEAGQMPGYRVEARGKGKALLRMVERGDAYRAGDEEIYIDLDKPKRPARG